MIQMRYDREVDALSITFQSEAKSARTVRVTESVRVDLDADGRIVALEVLDASDHVSRRALDQLPGAAVQYTLAEASKKSGLSSSTLRVQLNSGRIRGEKRGRDWVISAAELENYLESRETSGRPPTSAKARRVRKQMARAKDSE